MKQKPPYGLIARFILLLTLAFFVLPELITYIARTISPGFLAIPKTQYTGAGLFAVLLFTAVFAKNYRKLHQLPRQELSATTGYLLFSIAAFLIFLIFQWARLTNPYVHLILAWTIYTASILGLALALLGVPFFAKLWKDLLIATSALVFYLLTLLFLDSQEQITLLAAKITYWALAPFVSTTFTVVDGVGRLTVNDFTALIGSACSGIYSVVIFTAVFSFVYWLDYRKFNHQKAAWFFAIGLLGAYLVNIIRVSILFIIAGYYAPHLATGLFHNNAGWALFVTYSFVYWYFAYPRLLKKQ